MNTSDWGILHICERFRRFPEPGNSLWDQGKAVILFLRIPGAENCPQGSPHESLLNISEQALFFNNLTVGLGYLSTDLLNHKEFHHLFLEIIPFKRFYEFP